MPNEECGDQPACARQVSSLRRTICSARYVGHPLVPPEKGLVRVRPFALSTELYAMRVAYGVPGIPWNPGSVSATRAH